MKWYMPKPPPTSPTPITPTMTTSTVSTTTPAPVLDTADHVTDHVISFEENPTRKTIPDCVMKIKSPPSSLSLLNEVSK